MEKELRLANQPANQSRRYSGEFVSVSVGMVELLVSILIGRVKGRGLNFHYLTSLNFIHVYIYLYI